MTPRQARQQAVNRHAQEALIELAKAVDGPAEDFDAAARRAAVAMHTARRIDLEDTRCLGYARILSE
jgi:hypothetical protein